MTLLPTSIRIGYRDFTIENWDAKRALAAGKFGECDKNYAIIRVDTSYGPAQAAATLLHEIMHGCFDIAGIDETDGEERMVGHLSNQMAQVFRDNPDLMAYLQGALQP